MTNIVMRERRKELGMTQADLSEKSGVSRVTINKLETGKATGVNFTTMVKIASVLGKSVDVVFF